jgi:hypothetical protein
MRTQFSADHILFLHLRTHAQLRYHFGLTETGCAANESGPGHPGAGAAGAKRVKESLSFAAPAPKSTAPRP